MSSERDARRAACYRARAMSACALAMLALLSGCHGRMVRDIIRLQRERGATIFLNSHLLSEIEITCDEVVFIREGEVVTSRDLRAAQSDTETRIVVQARNLTPKMIAELAPWTAEESTRIQCSVFSRICDN